MKAINPFLIKKFLLCFIVMFAFGCAAKNEPNEFMSDQERYAQYFQEQHKAVLLPAAQNAIGTPYKFGGTTEEGFDCSGFVRWAYRYAGVNLPRTAKEQSKFGKSIKKQEELQAGDVVAFYHKRRGYHTGIYVGDGKFVHSPRRRTTVRISDLSTSYFKHSYLGGRRIIDVKDSEKIAAEELLAKYQAKMLAQAKMQAEKKSKKKKVSLKKANKKSKIAKKANKTKKAKT